MNIYFYDNLSSSFERLANKVAEQLVKIENNIRIIYIHDNLDNTEIKFAKSLNNRVFVINKSQVVDYIKLYQPSAYICFSYRIPDVYWNIFFKSRSIPTFQIQHGIYIDYFTRDLKSFIRAIPRNLLYLKYLVLIFFSTRSRIQTLKGILKKDIKGVGKVTKVDDRIKSDYLLVWGQYWIKWFKTYLYYDENTLFKICGNFDFKLLNDENKLIKETEKSVTYITQTLVEDSRLNIQIFNEFLDNINDLANKFDGKIYIKLHPRSDVELYTQLKKNKNVILTFKFPITEYYIGHYSTLLSLPAHLNKKILLISFPDHPIPHIFRQLSEYIQDYDEQIELDLVIKNKNNDSNYYYEYIEDPHFEIAKYIVAATLKV
jgi:hypothetical protein